MISPVPFGGRLSLKTGPVKGIEVSRLGLLEQDTIVGWLKQHAHFSQFWRLGGPRYWPIWFLVWVLLLACRWLPSHYVLTWWGEGDRGRERKSEL